VHVSSALGVLIPEMASITEDFPVDCSPKDVSEQILYIMYFRGLT